jgi:hypothetical protein
MREPVRHVVLDANIIAAYFCPNSTNSLRVRERSQVLIDAVLKAHWPNIRLYSPGICIAEARAVIDKYRFCTWWGPLKADPSKKLRAPEYRAAQRNLAQAVQSRRIEQMEHEPAHVLLAGLLSPVNNCFQFRRRRASKSIVKGPMGAADCLIAGMAILQGIRVGKERVILATDDQRLCDVMDKCRCLKGDRAATLGLEEVASAAGTSWRPDLYVPCLNIGKAPEKELREAFFGWPLPQSMPTTKRRSELTPEESRILGDMWLEISAEYGMSNPDSLPYTAALDDLRTRFALTATVCLPSGDIVHTLLNMRKASKGPFAKKQLPPESGNDLLFPPE